MEQYNTKLKPCPICGVPPRMGYACGEYFISGADNECPVCGLNFTEMHTSEELEIEAWNRRANQWPKVK